MNKIVQKHLQKMNIENYLHITPYSQSYVTSRISGGGNRISPVCVVACVFVSVCLLLSSLMVEPSTVEMLKIRLFL